MATFKPGVSANPAGKTPGTLNKIPKELRELVRDFCVEKFRTVCANFDVMTPAAQNHFWLHAASLVIPKRTQSDIDISVNNTTDENPYAHLTDAQLEIVLGIMKEAEKNKSGEDELTMMRNEAAKKVNEIQYLPIIANETTNPSDDSEFNPDPFKMTQRKMQDLAANIDAAGFQIEHNEKGKIYLKGFENIIDAWKQFNRSNADVSCKYVNFLTALQYIADLENSFEL